MPYSFEFNNLELVETSPGVFEGQDEKGAQQRHGGHRIRTEKSEINGITIYNIGIDSTPTVL